MTEYRVVEIKTFRGKEWYVQKKINPKMGWEEVGSGWIPFYSKKTAIRRAKDLKDASEYQETMEVVWP